MSKPQRNRGSHQSNKHKSSQQQIQRQRDRKGTGDNFNRFIEPAIQNNASSEDEEERRSFDHLKRETEDISKLTQVNTICSTWEKYQRSDIDDEDNNYDKPPDFETLLQMPLASGGHFKFKSEKHWDDIKSNSKFNNKYFTMDLNILNRNLLSIPAYERLELDASFLTPKQVLDMNTEARRYKAAVSVSQKVSEPTPKELNRVINILSSQENTTSKDDESRHSSDAESVGYLVAATSPVPELQNSVLAEPILTSAADGVHDEKSNKEELKTSSMNQILEAVERTLEESQLVINSVVKNSEGKIESGETEDLEKWLDDILDD